MANDSKTALDRAIELAGGQTALATRLTELLSATGRRITQQTISWWVHKCGGRVPDYAVLPIEQITSGKVSRTELRSDLYPAAEAA